LQYDRSFNGDIYFLAAGTVVLFLMMFTGGRKKLDRWEAAILLSAYILFTVLFVVR
jgi:cation:H+ antiporter